MKMFSILALAAAVFAVLPISSAEAGGRGCGCCGTVYAAPVAASPATAATNNAVAQSNQGYRSFSYQPGTAAPAMNYSSGYSNSYRRNSQPMWTNGANKALGRYN